MARNKYEKSAAADNPMVKLLGFLKPDKARVIWAIILSIIGVVCMLGAPLATKEISTVILSGPTGSYRGEPLTPELYSKTVLILAIIAVGFYLGSFIFSYSSILLTSTVCARLSERLRNAMSVKVNRLPLNYFDTRNIGDILSYFSNDVDVIGTTLNTAISTFISSVITLVLTVIILFVLNWVIALCSLLLLPIGFFILAKIGEKSDKFFVKRQELTSSVSARAEESYAGYNIIRVFRARKEFNNRFSDINFDLEKASDKADYYANVMMPLMTLFGNVLVAVVSLVGGLIACQFVGEQAKMFIPTIIAAINYADNLISPLANLAQTFASLSQTQAAAGRVFAFLGETNEPDESDKKGVIENVQGNIDFEHVKFGYNKDRIIVHDFSEHGKHGQKIAIVGPTGAGKTTMINLIMRFYEVNDGRILIDGIDTKTLNRSYVRGLFGMVLQDTWLFEGTIMENLKYSRPDATDEEVYAACKATHCDTFILQQPGGYNHILNEECGLSAGQKQLLTIARAMVQNAPMLILDEATSSVDTRTELQIQEAMDALMKGRTSFVIAHRLSTIKNSDLIIVMKDGDVIETGNHDELMAKDGFYAALYNSQFTGKGPQFS